MTRSKFILLSIAMASHCYFGTSFAQVKSVEQLQIDLVSAWLVVVGDEGRTRALLIKGISPTPRSDGTHLLEADYGFTDERQTPIPAFISQAGSRITLNFTTQSNSEIVVTSASDNLFVGTFTDKKGKGSSVRIRKLTNAEFQSEVTSAKILREGKLISPGPDVPVSCGSFFGGWSGSWNSGAFNAQKLWVASVEPDCTVKYSYTTTDSVELPKSFRTTVIKDGVMSLPCGPGLSGTCKFTRNGDEVWRTYIGPGYPDSGVMKRIR